MGKEVFIIAEAGVNHNGDISKAKRLIDAACYSGANAVKFQTFKAESIVSRYAEKAEYQKNTTDAGQTQYEMLKKLELKEEDYRILLDYSKKKGIMFLSSPFDLGSIDFLDSMGMEIFKIPSGEITNLPYLKKIGGLKKKVILSTGMADLEEIKTALCVLMNAGTLKKNITVLHCNTEYPTPFKDVNLKAMVTIKETLNISVGYSDHTMGIEVPIAAAALGAEVIEKHFTLDKNMVGPDHKMSLEAGELKTMIRAVRNIESAMGDGVKRASSSEIKNKLIVRKSLVASRDIKEGEIFTKENITIKRAGKGISPMEQNKVFGKPANRNFSKDMIIEL